MNVRKKESTPAAFTLIELLVVMMILAILVALAVGVARYVSDQAARKQTDRSQAILWKAVQVYYEKHNLWPVEWIGSLPAIPTNLSFSAGAGESDPCAWGAFNRIQNLQAQLSADPDARGQLQGLSMGSMTYTQLTDNYGNAQAGGMVFVDGWGTFMDYRDAASGMGMSSAPVLISAGPDRIFSSNTNPAAREADNIRTDGNAMQ